MSLESTVVVCFFFLLLKKVNIALNMLANMALTLVLMKCPLSLEPLKCVVCLVERN